MRTQSPLVVAVLAVTLAFAYGQEHTFAGLVAGNRPSGRPNAIPKLISLARTTLEGCLARGNEADPYLLTEKGSGKTVTVVGSKDLAPHVGHIVRVRGAMSAGERYFHATQVETLADSCLADEVPLPWDNDLIAEVRPEN